MIESRQSVDPLIDRTGGIEQFLEIDFDDFLDPPRTNLPQPLPTDSTTLPIDKALMTYYCQIYPIRRLGLQRLHGAGFGLFSKEYSIRTLLYTQRRSLPERRRYYTLH
jgi:hypothetical protein